MNLSNEEIEQFARYMQNLAGRDEIDLEENFMAWARSVAEELATRAVELAATRGVNLTTQQLLYLCDVVRQHEAPSAGDVLFGAFAALGARNAALEAEAKRLGAHVGKLEIDISGHVGVIHEKMEHIRALQAELASLKANHPGFPESSSEHILPDAIRRTLKDAMGAGVPWQDVDRVKDYIASLVRRLNEEAAAVNERDHQLDHLRASGQVAEDAALVTAAMDRCAEPVCIALAGPCPHSRALSRLAAAAQEAETLRQNAKALEAESELWRASTACATPKHANDKLVVQSAEIVRLRQRVDTLVTAATKATAELRLADHVLRAGQSVDPNLVMRALRVLERATKS